ncbi:MAG: sulfite exporter TauE/SafE family protein [Rhodobacterales bacterium]|nr:sulfite exporter TauE/SafE family protein [Rhodobacterales bacterium]
MHIILPIAETSINILVLLGMGGGVGFLSGLFGVGGGFLMTPLLIFVGIPPGVAVATGANQIVASSVSGVLAHWRRGNVDVRMGLILLAGGMVGSTLGVWLFKLLKSLGQIDLVIQLCYILFLGIIGLLMLAEGTRALLRKRGSGPPKRRHHTRLQALPWKMRFRKSRLYISALLPLSVGFVVGLLSAIMGVGGGFVMVPAMIYLIGMPTSVMVGTSLFQIIFVTANTTFLQATFNHTVDIVLAMILLVGGVIGAQFGARAGSRINGEQMRVLLALLVLAVCGKMALDLGAAPSDVYSIQTVLD